MFQTDLRHTPFSHRGSFLKIVPRVQGDLSLQTCERGAVSVKTMPADEWAHDLFSFALEHDGEPAPFEVQTTPVELQLKVRDGTDGVRIVFLDADTLLLEGSIRVALRLRTLQSLGWFWERAPTEALGAFQWAPLQWRAATGPGTTLRARETRVDDALAGSSHARAEVLFRTAIPAGEPWRAVLHLRSTLQPGPCRVPPFEAVLAERTRESDAWLAQVPAVPAEFAETAQRAWHLFYNLEVPAVGQFRRRPLLSTKDYLNQIWSWDMCFHALALARADLSLAWDQILLFFDRQAPGGQLPDTINESGVSFTYTKPPVIGWTILRLIKRHGWEANEPFLRQVYGPLGALTRWWYEARDLDGACMPVYLHGNDSGWDNATTFDQGFPTCGVDLAAYLVLQCECLATVAARFGKTTDAADWQSGADRQMAVLLGRYLVANRFVSPRPSVPAAQTMPSRSLLNLMPLVLGQRLPEAVRAQMYKDLSPDGAYLTPFGLASEPPDSAAFRGDGYWRGAVWAPTASLIAHGLMDTGKTVLAKKVATRWCRLCVNSPGFFENYSAVDGRGLRAPNTLWTAAVFLDLAAGILS